MSLVAVRASCLVAVRAMSLVAVRAMSLVAVRATCLVAVRAMSLVIQLATDRKKRNRRLLCLVDIVKINSLYLVLCSRISLAIPSMAQLRHLALYMILCMHLYKFLKWRINYIDCTIIPK